ncbi:hypothetical protein [Herbidospora daliensis]|uniref:hypothetical protein n=1 Tax=Herbidospora daliensis TaxID=295585 RepID=UPI000AE84215|nr:hypothetical protein [Herbidospora daliensis]
MNQCPGPLIWHDAPGGALLECARLDCGYLIVTGNFNDDQHQTTPLLRAGLAS